MTHPLYTRIKADIERDGLSIIGVGGSNQASFAYTIGLSEKHGFELIVVGLNPKIAAMFFNEIAAHLRGIGTIDVGIKDFRWAANDLPVMFRMCKPELVVDYAVQVYEYYGTPDVPILQFVMSDREGLLPGEEGFDNQLMHVQALLY